MSFISSSACGAIVKLSRIVIAGKGWFCGGAARAWLSANGVAYGPNLRLSSFPIVRRSAGGVIRLGSNVTLHNRLIENLAGVTHPCVFVAQRNARILIADHVGISGAVIFCTREIVIEKWVNLGAGVRIYDTDFHPLGAADRRIHRTDAIQSAPVRICEDAFVGAGAIILKGVTVGARAIIGAGAVVSRDVPADSIAAGVPARVIGHATEALASENGLYVE